MPDVEHTEARSKLDSVLKQMPLLSAFALPVDAWGPEVRQAWAALQATHTLLEPGTPLNIPSPKETEDARGYRVTYRGWFKVHYKAQHEELLDRLLKHLDRCQAAYENNNIKINATIPVYIRNPKRGRRDAAAWYYSRNSDPKIPEAHIIFIPKYLGKSDRQDLEVSIHEMAHYLHNEWLKDGMRNRTISDKYAVHQHDEDTGGSKIAQLRDELTSVKKEFVAFVRNLRRNRVPLNALDGRERVVVKTGNPRYKYRYPTMKITLEPVGGGATRSGVDAMQYLLGIEKDDPSRKAAEDYKRMLDEIADQWQRISKNQEDDSYAARRSKWHATDYGKQNAKEWFAENMVGLLAHPDSLDPEVKEWFEKVVQDQRKPITTEEEQRKNRERLRNALIDELMFERIIERGLETMGQAAEEALGPAFKWYNDYGKRSSVQMGIHEAIRSSMYDAAYLKWRKAHPNSFGDEFSNVAWPKFTKLAITPLLRYLHNRYRLDRIPVTLSMGWDWVEQDPRTLRVVNRDTYSQFAISQKMDYDGKYIDKWVLTYRRGGESGEQLVEEFDNPRTAVHDLQSRMSGPSLDSDDDADSPAATGTATSEEGEQPSWFSLGDTGDPETTGSMTSAYTYTIGTGIGMLMQGASVKGAVEALYTRRPFLMDEGANPAVGTCFEWADVAYLLAKAYGEWAQIVACSPEVPGQKMPLGEHRFVELTGGKEIDPTHSQFPENVEYKGIRKDSQAMRDAEEYFTDAFGVKVTDVAADWDNAAEKLYAQAVKVGPVTWHNT